MEIQGYPNYLIYDDGRVFSKYKKAFLISCNNDDGYHRVKLSNDGKRKNFLVHRLVAIHYIANPDNKSQVDHIDRNKSNNHVSNLRWATQSENCLNTIARKDNKLGIKNISYHKEGNGYHYQKKIRGELHNKFFKTLEEAIAYKEEFETNQK